MIRNSQNGWGWKADLEITSGQLWESQQRHLEAAAHVHARWVFSISMYGFYIPFGQTFLPYLTYSEVFLMLTRNFPYFCSVPLILSLCTTEESLDPESSSSSTMRTSHFLWLIFTRLACQSSSEWQHSLPVLSTTLTASVCST